MKPFLHFLSVITSFISYDQHFNKSWLLLDTNWECANCNFRQLKWSELDSIELYAYQRPEDDLKPGNYTFTFWQHEKLDAYVIDLRNANLRKTVELDSATYHAIKADSSLSSTVFQKIALRLPLIEPWIIYSLVLKDNPQERIAIQYQEKGFVRLYRDALYAEKSDLDNADWSIDRKNNRLIVTPVTGNRLPILYQVQVIDKYHIVLVKTSSR